MILSTLIYLHKKKVCHRDIKPENILFDEVKGELKLIDFEISKTVRYDHERLEMWTNTGTLQYKAPEMFKGKYNEIVDVWAVGVICYEMATGRLPFQNKY